VTDNFAREWDPARGVLSFARADSLVAAVPGVSAAMPRGELLRNFLNRYPGLFGPDDIMDTLRPQSERTDAVGFTHQVFQQVAPPPQLPTTGEPTGTEPAPTRRGRSAARTQAANTEGGQAEKVIRRGIEVYGAKLAAHFGPGGELVEVQSSCQRDLRADNRIAVTVDEIRKGALATIGDRPGFRDLQALAKRRKQTLFPLAAEPRVVLYPWRDRLVYAYATHGYHQAPEGYHLGMAGSTTEHDKQAPIVFGQMFFDAETGELFLFAPTRKGAETADTGSGLGSLPLGGPFGSRTLQVVRVDNGSTYRLRNTTKGRPIVTFDANANSSWVYPEIPSLIDDGTIPVSEDTDGDKTWNRVAASTSDADRTSSQQPEVDEHATAAELYDFYAALGGRIGWDDDQYSAPLVPDQAINVVAHTYDDGAGTSRSVNAFFDQELVDGHWVSHLAFFDGDPTGATGQTDDPSHPVWKFDYLAGSKAIVGHEYQHAVTDFSFVDGAGNPGLTYSDWLAAVHEGTSDVFGGLFSRQWWMGTDISPTGRIFRNLAFPRDTAAADPAKFDHWDDRNNKTGSGARYFRGDILAHAAYLMAQGGIHQRASRTPALIPVKGLGDETLSGLSVYKAARIIYRAYTHYLSNIGAATGLPANDESVFRTIRNGCVSAAIDLYGAGSVEHRTTVLAWYAVGLQPVGTPYGADVTFVTWGADWWMSRPYVGLSSPDWSSRDLFLNNGGSSEWNALINVMDGGTPTQYENTVYCRVRNVGTGTARNVQVSFEYTKITAGGATWLPMTDKDGNIQTLSVGDLTPGAMNFPDSAQDSPPASASVKWWIPPLETGETVDHFCIRATVFSIDDVNPTNNSVQSNIAYAPYTPGSGLRLGFLVANDSRELLPADIRVTHSLPEGWRAELIEQLRGTVLRPGENRRVHLQLHAAEGGTVLREPFDGRVLGTAGDGLGAVDGVLTDGALSGGGFTARVALLAADGAHLTGSFRGSLDVHSWRIDGTVTGSVQRSTGTPGSPEKIALSGCLRPDRWVHIAQYRDGRAIGGLSVQVQVPVPAGSCFRELPPTDTAVTAKPGKDRGVLVDAGQLLDALSLHGRAVCAVDLRSVLVEIRFRRQDDCS
ncbi:MAG TPA: M4 family metallopeptidase, partial [Nakamurella sp.]|nr:M4 family metallopeptidase [Nakamurella sp.]